MINMKMKMVDDENIEKEAPKERVSRTGGKPYAF